MNASRVAVASFNAAMRAYPDPAAEQQDRDFRSWQQQYLLRWGYYTNSAFEVLETWQAYKSLHRLYRNHRSIYNPTQRLCNFYAGAVYPGIVTADARRLPKTVRLAYPLPDDTPDDLRRALAQLWQWSNWQENSGVLVRWAAALGDTLVEVVDDLAGGKVYPELVWPGRVKGLTLDPSGHVKAYEQEYTATDETGKEYVFGKRVDQGQIVTYRDGQVTSETPNPYGFAPAVWVRHTNDGGMHGSPALRCVGKVDTLNDVASHGIDTLHKMMGAPVVVATGGTLTRLDGAPARQATHELPNNPAQDMDVLKAGPDAQIISIPLDTQSAIAYMEKLLTEIEADHPEITVWQALRDMSSTTGPAVSRLMGDVEGYVTRAQASYDAQCVKLFQMSIAIAGWRLSTGAWGPNLTAQQQAFSGFGLDSYKAGQLDMLVLPRPLIPLTQQEEMEIERQELLLKQERIGGAAQPGGLAAGVADRLRSRPENRGNQGNRGAGS